MRTMREHPGWSDTGIRPLRTCAGPAIARAVAGPTITVQALASDTTPQVDVYDPAILSEHVPAQVRALLGERGPVARLRNPDLWDAIATAIIRQVIRADQARLMYQRYRATFGEVVTAPGEQLKLLPDPETTLTVSDGDFAALGMAFKRRPLRAAAEAVVELGEKWQALPAARLVEELQTVPRIGPWTAGATVADYTGDFSFYPYGDMAVRKYAQRAAPSLDLPETEAAFATQWEGYTTTRRELSALTALTLALGGPRAEDNPPD